MEEKEKFLCPITGELMKEPVVDALGNTYDKAAIETWLKDHDTSPMTNKKLPDKKLIPNNQLMSLIHQHREDKIKEGLKIFPKLMSKEHFPLAEKLYAFIDKYNVVLKDNFCRKILETMLEVVPGLISAKPPSF